MRVLHVYSGNLYGGIEAMLRTIATCRTSSLQSDVALCFEGRLSRELEAADVRVHRLPEARASRPYGVRRARQVLTTLAATGGFDRVICHAAWSQAIFGPAVRQTDTPLVFWAHDVLTGRPWTERWARRTLPDLAICNSHFTAATLSTLYRDVPLSVVYPPVVTASPEMTTTERLLIRAELQTPPDAVVVIQATRSQAWKGHALLLEALARLRDVAAWTWWLAGGVQRPAEREFVDLLRRTVRQLGIESRVRFVGERSDVRRILAAADLYCQANLRPEPFGVTFVEALAAGLPVVTTAMGGALEIVDDSCGILVAPGDSRALAEALRGLIVDPTRRAQLSSGAPARARQVADCTLQMRALHEALANMTERLAV